MYKPPRTENRNFNEEGEGNEGDVKRKLCERQEVDVCDSHECEHGEIVVVIVARILEWGGRGAK